MLIDPIDSVRRIQSLQAGNHSAPFYPESLETRIHIPLTRLHVNTLVAGVRIHILQGRELLFTLLTAYNGHTLFCNRNFCSLIKNVLLCIHLYAWTIGKQ